MTTFRYHVVSLLSVLLALAAGIALGGGPLSEIGRADGATDSGSGGRSAAALTDRLDAATAASGFQDEVDGAFTGTLVAGRLTGRPVAVVVMPGADEKVVKALTGAVGQAGGTVSGTYAVRPELVDPDGKSLVDTLGSQVAESVEGSDVPVEATTYDRMGQLIGRAIGTDVDAGAAADAASTDILSSLRGGKLLSAPAEQSRLGSLVLVVLGTEARDATGADNIVGGLTEGLASRTDGVVVAGSTGSATDGLLGTLRKDAGFSETVSSVDSVQTAAGRLAAVLALSRERRSGAGHYGAEGADGALPQD